jgi:hypothetical protein
MLPVMDLPRVIVLDDRQRGMPSAGIKLSITPGLLRSNFAGDAAHAPIAGCDSDGC